MTDTDSDKQPGAEAQPFAAFLADHLNGAVNLQLGEELRDLVEAVAEHGKAGELQLKVKVRPAGANAGRQLLVACETTAKPPKAPPYDQIFFHDDAYQLTKRDPNARPLFDEENLQ